MITLADVEMGRLGGFVVSTFLLIIIAVIIASCCIAHIITKVKRNKRQYEEHPEGASISKDSEETNSNEGSN